MLKENSEAVYVRESLILSFQKFRDLSTRWTETKIRKWILKSAKHIFNQDTLVLALVKNSANKLILTIMASLIPLNIVELIKSLRRREHKDKMFKV